VALERVDHRALRFYQVIGLKSPCHRAVDHASTTAGQAWHCHRRYAALGTALPAPRADALAAVRTLRLKFATKPITSASDLGTGPAGVSLMTRQRLPRRLADLSLQGQPAIRISRPSTRVHAAASSGRPDNWQALGKLMRSKPASSAASQSFRTTSTEVFRPSIRAYFEAGAISLLAERSRLARGMLGLNSGGWICFEARSSVANQGWLFVRFQRGQRGHSTGHLRADSHFSSVCPLTQRPCGQHRESAGLR